MIKYFSDKEDEQLAVDWDQPQAVTKMSRTHEVHCRIKSFFGGWTTSTRMHESAMLPCLCGCRHRHDDRKYYVHCRRILRIIYQLLARETPKGLLARMGVDTFESRGIVP